MNKSVSYMKYPKQIPKCKLQLEVRVEVDFYDDD